jgi:hypothetical protein
VGVGIYAEQASELERAGAPGPIEIEAPRIGIDLHREAVLRASLQDLGRHRKALQFAY